MNAPKLRFDGFNEDWKTVKFKSLFSEVNEKTGDTKNFPLYSLTVKDGVTKKTDRYNREFLVKKEDGFKIVQTNYFVSNPMNMTIGALAQYKGSKNISVSGYYNVFKNISNYKNQFLEDYLKSSKMIWLYKSIATGSLIEKQRVHFSQFIELAVKLPDYKEANKISDFMEILTKKIQLQQEKIDLLKEQKRDYMQKFFNQKLRFRDDNGENFPEWSINSLNAFATINPKSNSLEERFRYIDLEAVNDGELLSTSIISKQDAPSRAQRVVSKGDILYQTVRPYQKNNLLYSFDFLEQVVASTGYAQIKVKDNVSASFLYQYLNTEKFTYHVLQRCTGTSYPAINSSDLGEIEIRMPILKEQQKIANFLSKLDEKISLEKKYLNVLQQQKQAFMQQMFL